MSTPLIQPDLTLTRDGLPLELCLVELVDCDYTTRVLAGERLDAMRRAIPSVHVDLSLMNFAAWNVGQQFGKFDRAVTGIFAAARFDIAGYLRRLCAYLIAMDRQWKATVSPRCAQSMTADRDFASVASTVMAAINTRAGDAVAYEQAMLRMSALSETFRFSVEPVAGETSESWLQTEVRVVATTARHVLSLLGRTILAAPDAVHAMLNHRGTADDALRALERAGSAAVDFAPRLLAEAKGSPGIQSGPAIAAIGRGDPDTVNTLIEFLQVDRLRSFAAYVLTQMDGELAGRNKDVVHTLMRLADQAEESPFLSAMASAERDNPLVRQRIVHELRARPAKMVAVPGCPSFLEDQTMIRRGQAIDATRYLVEYAEQILPLLIDAMDDFEEFDSDVAHFGPCARIANAIAHFGPRAANAAVPLARRIAETQPFEMPHAILHALICIGHAAREALPLLQARRSKLWGDNDVPNFNTAPADPNDDPIGLAIQKIRDSVEPPPSGL